MTHKAKLPWRWTIASFAAAGTLLWLAACQSRLSEFPTPTPIGTGVLKSAEAYLVRGDAYASEQNWKQAIIEYDQAIRLNPNFAEAYNNRGYAEYWNASAELAIADLSKAIDLRPDYPFAYNSRAAVYLSIGQPERAISDLDQAIALRPDFPQAYSNRGNAYLRIGRLDLALQDFNRAGSSPIPIIGLLCGVPTALVLLAASVAYGFRRGRRRTASS